MRDLELEDITSRIGQSIGLDGVDNEMSQQS
jgi:hypothetical protein